MNRERNRKIMKEIADAEEEEAKAEASAAARVPKHEQSQPETPDARP